MRLTIILLFLSMGCFGQGIKTNNQSGGTNTLVQNGVEVKKADIQSVPKVDKQKVDSLAIPIFSTKEVLDFLVRINKKALAIKELELSGDVGYERLVTELNKIIAEMDKKRKGK